MRILIADASGLLGHALTAAIPQAGDLKNGANNGSRIQEIVLVDCAAITPGCPASSSTGSTRIIRATYDQPAPDFIDRLISPKVDSGFHPLDPDRDAEAAYEVNVRPVRRFAEQSNGLPGFIFASSIAVFDSDISTRGDGA